MLPRDVPAAAAVEPPVVIRRVPSPAGSTQVAHLSTAPPPQLAERLAGLRSPPLVRPARPLPRAPFTPEDWRRVDGAAQRLGVTLGSDGRRAVRAAVEGRSVLVTSPEYVARQWFVVAAELIEQPALVVVAPAADLGRWHRELVRVGHAALHFPDEVRGAERTALLGRVARGGRLTVLLSAEALSAGEVQLALAAAGLGLCLVEQADRAAAAAPDHDPALTRAGVLLGRLGGPPLMAQARAVVPEVQREALEALGAPGALRLETDLVPAGVALDAAAVPGALRRRALVQLVQRWRRPGVVFAADAAAVDEVHRGLTSMGFTTHRDHPALPAAERARELAAYGAPGRRPVLVTTSRRVAPSPGDGPEFALPQRGDLSFVIHWQAPASLGQWREDLLAAGAGAEPLTAVILHGPEDAAAHHQRGARLRLEPGEIGDVASALVSAGAAREPVRVDALVAKDEVTRAARVIRLLEAAGLVVAAGGWVGVVGEGERWSRGVAALAAAAAAQLEGEAREREAVARFLATRECRMVAFAAHFGVLDVARCGRCSVCTGEPELRGLSEGSQPRRPAVREFVVTPAHAPYQRSAPRLAPASGVVGFPEGWEQRAAGWSGPPPRNTATPSGARPTAPLTAKLGDFGPRWRAL